MSKLKRKFKKLNNLLDKFLKARDEVENAIREELGFDPIEVDFEEYKEAYYNSLCGMDYETFKQSEQDLTF